MDVLLCITLLIGISNAYSLQNSEGEFSTESSSKGSGALPSIDWDNIVPRHIEPSESNLNYSSQNSNLNLHRIVGGEEADFENPYHDLGSYTTDWSNLVLRLLSIVDDFENNKQINGNQIDDTNENFDSDTIDWSSIVPRIQTTLEDFEEFYNQTNGNHRIVGGAEATPNSIQYQAAIIITVPDGLYFCGGSLISEKFILTAAHCLDGASQVQVILGAHKRTEVEPNQQIFISKKFKIHELYNSATISNDIGVIELPEKAILNEYVKTIALPSYFNSLNPNWFKGGKISGWGKETSQSSLSEVLKVADITVFPNIFCSVLYNNDLLGSVCTFGFLSTAGCNGDSGGPLVVKNKLIGIASFGMLICENGFPTVYTRVAYHLTWIQANTDVTIDTF